MVVTNAPEARAHCQRRKKPRSGLAPPVRPHARPALPLPANRPDVDPIKTFGEPTNIIDQDGAWLPALSEVFGCDNGRWSPGAVGFI